jgi:hypothetical protein
VNEKASIWIKSLVDAISNGLISEMEARDALRRVERTYPELIGAAAVFDVNMAKVAGSESGIDGIPAHIPMPLDWEELFKRDNKDEWIVRSIWPKGRQIHIHAARKTGKSLVALWMAANIAIGRDPFSGEAAKPVKVAYLDFEMTEDDLLERIEDMGFTAEQLEGKLLYFLHPALPKFDTLDGGMRLMELLKWHDCEAVIVDTVSRVVEGDENSNDTYIRMFNCTGELIKAAGISLARLDHEGHSNGRSRGASAKADDVDLVWQLKETDDGYALNRMYARISWAPETLALKKTIEPSLSFKRDHENWPAGTKDKADELDKLLVPIDATKRAATNALKANGLVAGRAEVITAALRYRKQRSLIIQD